MTDNANTFVTEQKFNGTATYEVRAPNEKAAKAGARRFWKEEYGHSPSKIVAEQNDHVPGEDYWTVIVAQHSSGSLKGNKEYEYAKV